MKPSGGPGSYGKSSATSKSFRKVDSSANIFSAFQEVRRGSAGQRNAALEQPLLGSRNSEAHRIFASREGTHDILPCRPQRRSRESRLEDAPDTAHPLWHSQRR